MEKIFDIAKDSEKSWGVIAQGIDENFEELSLKVDGLESLEEVIDYAVNSGIRIMNFKDVFESGVVI